MDLIEKYKNELQGLSFVYCDELYLTYLFGYIDNYGKVKITWGSYGGMKYDC